MKKKKPSIIVKDQTQKDGILTTFFTCGCIVSDNRKRLYELDEKCGKHELEDLIPFT